MAIGQAARLLGITVESLQRWERAGRLVFAARKASNRRQLQYKSARYGTRIVLTDRWYPSSKLCSGCGARNGELILGEWVWTCTACGIRHDHDVNAAINLQRLATGALAAHTALPEASQAVTPGTAAGMVPAAGGEVTPVRHEHGQQDGSGQEEYAAHVCARF